MERKQCTEKLARIHHQPHSEGRQGSYLGQKLQTNSSCKHRLKSFHWNPQLEANAMATNDDSHHASRIPGRKYHRARHPTSNVTYPQTLQRGSTLARLRKFTIESLTYGCERSLHRRNSHLEWSISSWNRTAVTHASSSTISSLNAPPSYRE